MIVFAREQIVHVREGRITGTLLLPSVRVRRERPRAIYQTYVPTDEWGKPLDRVTERLLDVVMVESYAFMPVDRLHERQAEACGVKSAEVLQEQWVLAHPKSPLVQFVEFTYGDRRQQAPRYLASTRSMRWGQSRPSWRTREVPSKPRGMEDLEAGQGDYTGNALIACDDAEVLSPSEMVVMARQNHQAGVARSLREQAKVEQLPFAERLKRIEAGGKRMRGQAAAEARGPR